MSISTEQAFKSYIYIYISICFSGQLGYFFEFFTLCKKSLGVLTESLKRYFLLVIRAEGRSFMKLTT